MSFDLLGLSEELLSVVAKAGYSEPTPIQKKAIPSTLQGRDILGIAQTGTGKTASFTLPMIDILSQGRARARMPRSLILEPTRELAAQVSESFEKYGEKSKLSMALLIGGVAFGDQEKKLDRGVDVLIATPGRLLDHIQRGKILLSGVEILVVDEADRMLDMGFIPDVEKICKAMPKKLQSLFFSATMPKEVKRLTDQFLKDPKEITVSAPTSTASTITQYLCQIKANERFKGIKGSDKQKRDMLRHLIKDQKIKNAIIFCNRKSNVKIVAKSLKIHGFNAGELHGDMHQTSRMETLANFKSGDLQILVASDVAARGLDIPDVSHIFNFEIPNNPEDYIHRIGRTGRAGKEGHSFTLCAPSEKKYLIQLEKFLGKKISEFSTPDLHSKPATDKKDAVHKQDNKSAVKEKSEKKSPQKQNIPSSEKAPQKTAPSPGKQPNKKVIIGMGDHVPAFLLRDEVKK